MHGAIVSRAAYRAEVIVPRRTLIWTVASLVAFASNSILCRLALAAGELDATTFTTLRLASGALVLGALAFPALRRDPWPGGLRAAAALFLYAAPFSYAYLRLGAGVGALVLFATVQATMIGWGMVRGERSPVLVWVGLALALAGLVVLTAPGANAPDPIGAALMAVAGVAWGAYSLLGRTASAPPLVTTAASFLRTAPMIGALFLVVLARGGVHASPRGIALAATSGALASGVGYSLWYAALRDLTATRAAVLQLLVPILAAGGGVALLGERPTMRLVLAAGATIGGVALAIRARTNAASRSA